MSDATEEKIPTKLTHMTQLLEFVRLQFKDTTLRLTEGMLRLSM